MAEKKKLKPVTEAEMHRKVAAREAPQSPKRKGLRLKN